MEHRGARSLHPPATAAITRRRLLALGGAAPVLLGPCASRRRDGDPAELRGRDIRRLAATQPFGLGVASGEPLPTSVVIWTRVAPDPWQPGAGTPLGAIRVQWQMAADERFSDVIASGSRLTGPGRAHSVHVEVPGLRPWREYFYRFRVGDAVSPTGRTRTAPAPDTVLRSMSLCVASCQAWWQGHYTAYADLARQEPDLVFHAGDYVYEAPIPADGGPRRVAVPSHHNVEPRSLDEYRDRYALYKSDVHLRRAHRLAPWIVGMDDHEVDNNWAGPLSEDLEPPDRFLARRANAFRAWYEHMPVRSRHRPDGPDAALFRRFTYGRLAQFDVLDTRQHRDDQAMDGGANPPNPASRDPRRTMLGDRQERWLQRGFRRSSTTWNVLAQQVAMTRLDLEPGPGASVPMDSWDGYHACRRRILAGARERGVRNLVSLAGDAHRALAARLRLDVGDGRSPVAGVELMATSISSAGDGEDLDERGWTMVAENPDIAFMNKRRGYLHCTITARDWTTRFRVADYVTRPHSPMHTRATVTVEAGDTELHRS